MAVDLRSSLGPIRDQGTRPTCLAFAASSVHEQARRRTDPLSVEALFLNSKRRDGWGLGRGTTVPAVLEALADDGQCDERMWPYGGPEPMLFPGDYQRARPDTRVDTPALLLDVARRALDAGRVAVLVVYVTAPWFMVRSDGVIRVPHPSDPPLEPHAVVIAGYDDSTSTLLIRNSWSTDWGVGGYGFLPYPHVEHYGLEVFTLTSIVGP